MKKIILVLSIIITIVIIVLLYYSKNSIMDRDGMQNANTSIEENNEIKKYISKNLIYDAEYKLEGYEETWYYIEDLQKECSLSDIKVPYININTEDANKANNAIKDLYNQTVEYYKKDIDKMYSSETNDLYYDLNFYECKYRYYINSDILSICVFQKIGGQDSSTNNYLAYNFDLKTGNLVRYEDICKAIDFPIEEANEKVKKVIRNYEVYVYMEENEYYEDELLDSLKEKSVKNFEENNFQYFISDNGILNIIVQIDVPAGGGEFNTLFKVHKEDNFNNYELYNMREMKDGNSFVKYIENENTDMYESWYTINRNEGTKWHFAERIIKKQSLFVY